MFHRECFIVVFNFQQLTIFSYNLYISLLKFFHCIIVVWYGNKFKSVRITTDTLTPWTITAGTNWLIKAFITNNTISD